MSDRLPFYSDCVAWPRDLLPALELLVEEGVEITRETFVRRTGVNPNPKIRAVTWHGGRGWIRPYGYHYFRLRGLPVVWFTNSAIEHVYADDETILRVQERAT